MKKKLWPPYCYLSLEDPLLLELGTVEWAASLDAMQQYFHRLYSKQCLSVLCCLSRIVHGIQKC